MTRRVLVTGGSGFVGQWLSRALLEAGDDVFCADHTATAPERSILSTQESRAIHWTVADVRSDADIDRAIGETRPDVVFHLAGVTFVPEARERPVDAYEINVLGAARLLVRIAAGKRAGEIDPIVVVVGSAEEYGAHPASALPLTEDAPLHPATVYAASKAAQEMVALQWARSEQVRVVATRSFNHSGPGQSDRFLVPALVKRALDVKHGRTAHMVIGNGTPVRDYLHVRDVAAAYLELAARGTPGEVYNVSSGRGTSVSELVDRVRKAAGIDAPAVTDPSLVRPVDVPSLVGSNAKLTAATGWSPTRSVDDIIADLIDAATR